MPALGFGALAGGAVSGAGAAAPVGVLVNSYSEETVIYEFSYTTGTGDYALAGGWSTHLPLSARYPGGATGITYYVKDGSTGAGSQFEVGIGDYDAGAKTLSRLLVLASSSNNQLVDWSGRTRLLIRPLVPSLPLCPTVPTIGQVLTWDGTQWCPATPSAVPLCPTPPMDGQVLIWSAADNAYCPADLCALVAACVAPSFLNDSEAMAVSGDGSIVVGDSFVGVGATGPHAFRWTSSAGMVDLGTLPGDLISAATLISNDGSTIVGISANTTGFGQIRRAFRWTSGGGMQDLGNLGGGGYTVPTGVTPDGSVIVGYSLDVAGNSQPFRWTSGGGIVDIGHDPAGAPFSAIDDRSLGVSDDGLTVVGNTVSSADVTFYNTPRAIKWTSGGGLVEIGTLGTSPFQSDCTAITPDGSAAFGWYDSGGHQFCKWDFPSNTQTAVPLASRVAVAAFSTWAANGGIFAGDGVVTPGISTPVRVYYYTPGGGIIDIGDLGGGASQTQNQSQLMSPSTYYYKAATSLSRDGTTVIGQTLDGGSNTLAFSWTSGGGMVSLGTFPGGSTSVANSVSNTGSVIVGSCFTAGAVNRQAFRWTAGGGMVNLGSL